MSDVFDQDREFGIDGQPDSDIPGGGLAASGQVTMQKVKRQATDDDGSDADAADVEETE